MRAFLACALFAVAATACSGGSPGGGSSPPPPPPPAEKIIRKTVLVGQLNEPVALDVLPDGSVFVIERKGRVLWWRAGTGVAEAATFTDIYRPPAGQTSEFGLLSIAAHPDFAANNQVFVMYDAPAGAGVEQRVSRFTLAGGRFDMSSEHVLLSIPYDINCCHTGGAMHFGPDGVLYIATGDNTDPFIDAGYAPIDPRPNRAFADALRSSANTNDLRGKVLRIRPNTAGGYDIPTGNLFSDPAQGRPEIYLMGLRNPYTMALDSLSGALYVGDVGPDADNDSAVRGPRGYDEINRVTQAGNLGWPLFIGANFPYNEWNYDTATGGAPFDPAAPVNTSPRNTGALTLPPAQPALIYYPDAASSTFPALGQGGRTALVAGVYRSSPVNSTRALPVSYSGKLFIADFIRDWMMTVTLDQQGGIIDIARFAPEVTLSGPLDFEFGPDGALYVVEYGQGFFTANPDAALSRIEYSLP